MIPSETIEKLTFKNIIMSIGVLPSSYVDSMSYYETLVWLCNYLENTVIPAVNNNGQAVEELQGLFVQLKNYVDSYFDNLDVQEEINKKVDEMVEDGTLTNIIKEYVDPIYEDYETQINQQLSGMTASIENIDTKVDAVTSGSPAGVYSTVSDLETADPDHDKIYVVTADGKWYYYDTSLTAWTAGGTYQSTVLNDVDEDRLSDVYADLNNIYETPQLVGLLRYSDGTINTGSTSAAHTDFIIIKGYDKIEYTTNMGNSGCDLAFYDINKNYLKDISIQGDGEKYATVVDVPSTAYYVMLCCYGATYIEQSYIKAWKIGNVKDTVTIDHNIMNTVEDEFIFTFKPTLNGYISYNTGNNVYGTNSRHTDLIDVGTFTHLIFDNNMGSSGASVAYYNSSKVYMKSDSIAGSDSVNTILAIPAGAQYLIFSTYGTQYFDSSYIKLFTYNQVMLSKYPFFNKNILIFGDSITDCCDLTINEDNETTAYSWRNPSSSYSDGTSTIYYSMWPKILKDNYVCKEIRNYAKTGASYKYEERSAGNERQNLSYQIQVALNDRTNPNDVFNQDTFTPDIIIFALGTNDGNANDSYESAMNKTVLISGTTSIDVDATIANLNLTKFNEAARYAFLKVKEQWPMAQIYVVLPIQRADSEVRTVNEDLRKMGLRYGAIIVDGAGNTGITREFDYMSQLGTYLKDGLHPNEKGQNLLARTIIKSMYSNYMDFTGMNE